MIERAPFGSTGHESSRVIFGAAALGAMRQAKADSTLETLHEYGINHIDTAASYGDAELRLAPFLRQHRNDFFLATKTGDRDAAGARESLHRSLERMGFITKASVPSRAMVASEASASTRNASPRASPEPMSKAIAQSPSVASPRVQRNRM